MSDCLKFWEHFIQPQHDKWDRLLTFSLQLFNIYIIQQFIFKNWLFLISCFIRIFKLLFDSIWKCWPFWWSSEKTVICHLGNWPGLNGQNVSFTDLGCRSDRQTYMYFLMSLNKCILFACWINYTAERQNFWLLMHCELHM